MMLPVPVPEAELSSPDTMLPEMKPRRLVAVAIDDVASASTGAELSSPDTSLPEMKP